MNEKKRWLTEVEVYKNAFFQVKKQKLFRTEKYKKPTGFLACLVVPAAFWINFSQSKSYISMTSEWLVSPSKCPNYQLKEKEKVLSSSNHGIALMNVTFTPEVHTSSVKILQP